MVERVVTPNYGLYFNLPPIGMPIKALQDGYNFRIKNGVLSNLNLGWERFYADDVSLGSRVLEIWNFFPRELGEKLVFFTMKDVLAHDANSDLPVYLTPIYDTGTASASGTAVTGVGTTWTTNAKEGDYIHFGDAAYNVVDADEWFEIASVDSNTGITLVEDAGTIGSGAYTIRQTFTGTASDLWSVDTFVQDEVSGDDFIIATNGVQAPISWNGSDATVTVHDEMGFVATWLVRFSNMIVYGNVVAGGVDYPTSIINSDVGKPFAAGDTGTGLSEQFRVTDRPEPIVRGIVLGNNLVIYSLRVGVVVQFAGDPLIFIFRTGFAETGVIGPLAVVDFGDYHQFFAPDGEYSFDGVSIREINKQAGRDVIRTADPLRRSRTRGHFDEENGDLIWSVPGVQDASAGELDGAPETAWVEHYLEVMPMGVERPWSKRAWPFTASGYFTRNTGLTWQNAPGTWEEYNYAWNDQFASLGFPLNLVGDANGVIFIANQSQTGDGAALPSFVHTGRRALADGKMRALLKRIYPFTGQFDETLNITTYLADFATSAVINGGTLAYDTSHVEGQFFVTPYRRARYVEIRFSSPGTPWSLEGWDFEVQSGGKR